MASGDELGEVVGGDDPEQLRLDGFVGSQGAFQGHTTGRVGHNPGDGREQAVAGLVGTCRGVTLVYLGFADDHRWVLGGEIGFAEPVIFVVAAGGDDGEIGFEPFECAVWPDEGTPTRGFRFEADQLDRLSITQFMQLDGELGHGQGVGGEGG